MLNRKKGDDSGKPLEDGSPSSSITACAPGDSAEAACRAGASEHRLSEASLVLGGVQIISLAYDS